MNSNDPVQVDRRLIVGAAVLIGVGGFLIFTGALLGSTALAAAARKWVRQLERPPSEMARMKWQQLRAAGAAGTQGWRDSNHSSSESRSAGSSRGSAP